MKKVLWAWKLCTGEGNSGNEICAAAWKRWLDNEKYVLGTEIAGIKNIWVDQILLQKIIRVDTISLQKLFDTSNFAAKNYPVG